jgi:hypothetical protein
LISLTLSWLESPPSDMGTVLLKGGKCRG